MKEEDSKGLAEAGTFGIEIAFKADNMMKDRFVSELGQFIMSIAMDVEARKGGLVGHVKAFARVDDGFVKLNIVDCELGIDIGDEIRSNTVTAGTIKIMAAVVGVDDHHIKGIIENRILDLGKIIDIEVAGHKGHDHRHDDGK